MYHALRYVLCTSICRFIRIVFASSCRRPSVASFEADEISLYTIYHIPYHIPYPTHSTYLDTHSTSSYEGREVYKPNTTALVALKIDNKHAIWKSEEVQEVQSTSSLCTPYHVFATRPSRGRLQYMRAAVPSCVLLCNTIQLAILLCSASVIGTTVAVISRFVLHSAPEMLR